MQQIRLVGVLKPVKYCSGIAPGGLTKPAKR